MNENGWEDDWDFELDEDTDDNNNVVTKTNDNDTNNNDDDDNVIGGGSNEGLSPSMEEGVEKELTMKEKLVRYLKGLQSIDLNEWNKEVMGTPSEEDALDLYAYYKERPDMVTYTIDVEVPRMKYSVLLSDGNVATETAEVQHYLRQMITERQRHNSILIRAANQSLLADVLPLLYNNNSKSSKSGLVWNHQEVHCMSMIAQSCHFVVDASNPDPEDHTVHVDCTLQVQLPASIPPLAQIRLKIEFHPNAHFPSFSHEIVSITPSLNADDDSIIDPICQILQRDYEASLQQHLPPRDDNNSSNIHNDNNNRGGKHRRRDDFFKNMLHPSAREVWKDIDAVVNVSSKLQFLKQSLFIPQEELFQDQHHPDDDDADASEQQPVNRPPSIVMGGIGLLSSGFSKLASVTTQQQQQQQQPQRGYPPPPPPSYSSLHPTSSETITFHSPPQRRIPPPPPPPKHHNSLNKISNVPAQSTTVGPKRIPPPPPPPQPTLNLSTKHNADNTQMSSGPSPEIITSINNNELIEEQENGWSDDDDVLDELEEDELSSPLSNTSTMKTSLTMDHAIQITKEQAQQVVMIEEDTDTDYFYVPSDFRYNPDDGIILTRKRFVSTNTKRSNRLFSTTVQSQ